MMRQGQASPPSNFHGKAPIERGEGLGHEAVGVVEAVGSAVTRFAPGDIRGAESRFAPENLPRIHEIHAGGVNVRVLAFTFAVSLVTGILFGLVPALAASNPDQGKLRDSVGAAIGHARAELREIIGLLGAPAAPLPRRRTRVAQFAAVSGSLFPS